MPRMTGHRPVHERIDAHPANRLIGRVLFAYDMPVERGKIREFAAATGATDPAYLGSIRRCRRLS